MESWLKVTHPIYPLLWFQLNKMIFKFFGKFTKTVIHQTWKAIKQAEKPLMIVTNSGPSFPACIPYSLLHYNISSPFLA